MKTVVLTLVLVVICSAIGAALVTSVPAGYEPPAAVLSLALLAVGLAYLRAARSASERRK